MSKLIWSNLLCEERIRESTSKRATNYHNEFDKDYSRVVYSSSVRRLQDKAQVFPLQENDFTRTRLTHSIEVASLGRSLSWGIGDWLYDRGEFESIWDIKKFASMVETACLLHDLGNPPFGHYGEEIIRKWFAKWFNSEEYGNISKKYKKQNSTQEEPLNEQQKCDFLFFEGNAQGIRILTKLQIMNDRNGMNLALGTLSTLIKYPWYSNDIKCKDSNKGNAKLGCFYSEREIFEIIKGKVGISPCKHPATLILEAADDIAYLPSDLEDAIKKRVVKWDVIYKRIMGELRTYDNRKLEQLDDYIKDAEKNKVPDIDLIKMQNLKIILQGIFIEAVKDEFFTNYDSIMNGCYEGSLLENSKAKDIVTICKQLANEFIFCDNEILSLELVGDRVISDLLDMFINAIVVIEDCSKSKSREQKIYSLISENFRYVQAFDRKANIKVDFNQLKLYDKLQLVTDYISGMTDSYAVNLHQKLLGTRMP